jgi:hypothetical protein
MCSVLLAACQTVPVVQKFPIAPLELTVPCNSLSIIDTETITLSQLSKNIAGNYAKYHICAAQVDAWNEWYQTQRKNFESIK